MTPALTEMPPWARTCRMEVWGKRVTGRVTLTPPLLIELALTDRQRAKGLQDRTTFVGAVGMLFQFPVNDRHGIWMKRTYFDLDVSWLGEGGIIMEQHQLRALDERTVRPKNPARFVLELPANSHQFYGLKPGDWLVRLP